GHESCGELRREHLWIRATDGVLHAHTKEAEAEGAAVEVSAVAILHVEDGRNVREHGLDLGALARELRLELAHARAEPLELGAVVVVTVAHHRPTILAPIELLEETLDAQHRREIA